MKEISIIALWLGLALATWGAVDLMNRLDRFIKSIFIRIRDADLMCDLPDWDDVQVKNQLDIE